MEKGIISENLSKKIYHFTSLTTAMEILRTDTMFCQSALAGAGADDMSDKYKFYISFTRVKSPFEGFGFNYDARFEFDGEKLSERYKGGPVNYWGAGDGLHNKWYYHRRASGRNNFYRYWHVDEIPDGAVVKNVNSVKAPPFLVSPTAKSPEYVNWNGEYLKKEYIDETELVTKSLKYIPTNDKDADFKDIDDYGFKWPSEFSPDYVDYKGKRYKKELVMPDDIQRHSDNEAEDRLFTNDSEIKGIKKYITRLDIFVDKNSGHYDNIETKSAIYNLVLRFPFVYAYDNKQDFALQSENTINEEIKNEKDAYDKYRNAIQTFNKDHGSLDAIAKAFFILYPSNGIEQKIASTMKKYGFEQYVGQVIREYKRTYGLDNAVQTIGSDIQNMSKSPNPMSQKILQLISDLLTEKGFHNFREAYKSAKEKLERSGRGKWDYIDTETTLSFKILKHNYHEYNITNDAETDFWYVFDMENGYEKQSFIENVMYELEYQNPKNINLFRLKKYLKTLAFHRKKVVTVNEMLDILDKIFDDKETIQSILGYPEITTIECNYWDFPWNIQPPYPSNDEEQNDYKDKLFIKKQLGENIMKKNKVKLTENQLHQVIKESVKNILKEYFYTN